MKQQENNPQNTSGNKKDTGGKDKEVSFDKIEAEENTKDKQKNNLDDDIKFEETNDEADIHPLIDDERLVTPGNNIIIEGDPALLTQPIPQREQAMKKVDITGKMPGPDSVPEPNNANFSPPPPPPQPQSAGTPGGSKNSDQNFNSGFNSAGAPPPPPKPKTNGKEPDPHLQSADFMHRTFLQGGLHLLGKQLGLSMKQLDKLHNAGKINKHTPVPVILPDNSQSYMSIEQRVGIHNQQISNDFDSIVSEDWIEENNPLLANILRKRQVAMSPESQYGINLGLIGVSAVVASINCVKTNKELLAEFQRISTPPAPAPSPVASVVPLTPEVPGDQIKTATTVVDDATLIKDSKKIDQLAKKALGANAKSSRKKIQVGATVSTAIPAKDTAPENN